MENYFNTKNKKLCNGCGVCALKCPKNAITMIEDEEGFIYPEINKEKCINCGLCEKVCSNYPKTNEYKITAYATKNKNKEERKSSTSGGMFKIIAQNVIKKHGIVFGVKYDDNLKVVHDYAENMEKCKKFSISKYVRSDLKDSYNKTKEFLDKDRWVLFTGTPCQCYGLRKFLAKDYEKLVICEIICHSNPSPKVFEMYIKNREQQNGKKIKVMHFRSKNNEMENGSYIEFIDGDRKKDKTFNKAFNDMLISRPSCSKCSFCDTNRKADITIGDFWGIENVFPEFIDDDKISLLTVNTEKGMKIFNEIKQFMYYKESDLIQAFKSNHNSNQPEHKKRAEFFEAIKNGKITRSNITEMMQRYTKVPLIKKVLRKLKRIAKKVLKK